MGRHARAARRAGLEGHAHDHPRQRRRPARRRADARSGAGRRRSTAASPAPASATSASPRSAPNTADSGEVADRRADEGRRDEADRRRPPHVERHARRRARAGAAVRRQGHAGDPRSQGRRRARRSRPPPATAPSRCRPSSSSTPARPAPPSSSRRRWPAISAPISIGEHTIGRAASQKLVKLPDGSRPLAVDDALSHAGRRRRCTKRDSSRRSPSTSPDVEFGQPAPTTDPMLDKAIERLREESAVDAAVGLAIEPISARRLPDPSAILTVRLTPVFSRCRRVAQRLERLLDTQEVGGSSPPVPTNSAQRVRPHRNPRHESGHRHASRWLESHRARRHARARRRGRDLSAPRQGGAGRRRRRQARRPVVSARAGRARSASSPTGAPRRCRSTATARRICWRRRSRTCFPARSAASARRPTRASSTTSSSPRPFVPGGSRGDRAEDEGAGGAGSASTSGRCGRARRRRRSSRSAASR